MKLLNKLHTSWAFGKRLREAGLLGSMGTVGDCYDNSMMESFWGTMQLELLDRQVWKSRKEPWPPLNKSGIPA